MSEDLAVLPSKENPLWEQELLKVPLTYQQAYDKKHRARKNIQKQKYYALHKEVILAQQKARRLRNIEERLEWERNYRKANREKINRRKRERYKLNKR